MNLDVLARPSGGLAMVAMDQRESLRRMFAVHRSGPVGDDALTRFKLAVAREVGPHASGFLIDREFGFRAVTEQRLLPAHCGLILAADLLSYQADGRVSDTMIDPVIDPDGARRRGAVALKLLVVWRSDAGADRRLAMAAEFVKTCADAGLVSVLEGVVRPAPGEDPDLLQVDAARELGGLRPTLYKSPVPRAGAGDPAEVGRLCARLTEVLPVPWVVVSQGVSIVDFPNAVRLACRGGASGFLAGRAIWSDAVGAADPAPPLRERAVERLLRLADVVDEHARPWREAL
jgi:sulfofructosephosphate aldolase